MATNTTSYPTTQDRCLNERADNCKHMDFNSYSVLFVKPLNSIKEAILSVKTESSMGFLRNKYVDGNFIWLCMTRRSTRRLW